MSSLNKISLKNSAVYYTAFLTALLPVSLALTLSDPTSNLVRQYDFPVPIQCRKTSDTVFVAFVRPLSETVRRLFSFSTEFSQHLSQVVLFMFLHVFSFKTVG
jgi:hypothetical protein